MDSNPYSHFTPTGDALFDRFGEAYAERGLALARHHEQYVEALIADHGFQHLRGKPSELRAALKQASHTEPSNDRSAFHEQHPELSDRPDEVPVAAIMDWKAQFATDPRYWQLLSTSISRTRFGGKTVDEHFSRLIPDQYLVLIEAVRKGAADGLVLLMLRGLYDVADSGYVDQQLMVRERMSEPSDPVQEVEQFKAAIEYARKEWAEKFPDRVRRMEQHLEEMEKEGPPERWVDKVGLQLKREHFEADHAAAQKIVAEFGLTLTELYDAAVEASPEWAQIRYQRAGFQNQQGQPMAALQSVESGNAAQVNRALAPFPSSFALRYALDHGVPGSLPLFTHVKLMDGGRLEVAELANRLQGVVRSLGEDIPLSRRMLSVGQLVLMSCRYAEAELASKHDAQLSLLLIAKTFDACVTRLHELGKPAEAFELENHSVKIRQSLRALMELELSSPLDCDVVDSEFALTLEEEGRQAMAFYQRQFDDWRAERRALETLVWPVLADIKQLDFVRLAS